MNKAIFYKEWVKTRWFFLAFALIFACYTIYMLLRFGQIMEFKGADHFTAILLTRETVFIETLEYIPLVAGILLAVVQFVPEMTQKRIKLTLHLPYPQKKMILMMYAAGLAELLPIFLLQGIAIGVYLGAYIPCELVDRILLTSLPWYAAGIVAYTWGYAVCLEPTWKMRAVLMLMAAGLLRVFFLSDTPQAYDCFLPALTVFGLGGLLVVFRSMVRFKEGCQD